MQSKRNQAAGIGLVALLLACAILFAAYSAHVRSVRLKDAGPSRRLSPGEWPDMRIDINRAGLAELALLPGLGPGLAQRILDDRELHGPFNSVDDLRRVKGIGGSIIERLKPYAVTTSDLPAAADRY